MINTVNYMYILFIILIFMSIFLLLLNKGDFLNPSFLISITMTVSVFFAMLNIERWDLYIGMKTCIVIISSIFSFSVGGIWCAYKLNLSDSEVKFENPHQNKLCAINIHTLIILSVIMIILGYFSFRELYELSVSLGNDSGYDNMIRVVRMAIENHQVTLSRWMNYRQLLAQLIAYFYIYIIVYNVILNGFKWNRLLSLIPVFLYIPFIIMTTGRMSMMIMIIYSIMIIAVLYRKKHGDLVETKIKLFGILIAIGCVALLGFLLLGFFTGKTVSSDRTPFVIFSHYAGLSIPALDVLLNQPSVISGYIGGSTFLGIYRIADTLGMGWPEVQTFLPFTQFNNIDTNVYTAVGRYFYDFGYFGMLTIMWILGVLYTGLYYFVIHGKLKPFFLILYAAYSFPLFLSSIDERFFLDIVGTSFVYTVAVSWILYRLLIYGNISDSHKGTCGVNDNGD